MLILYDYFADWIYLNNTLIYMEGKASIKEIKRRFMKQ